MGCRARPTHKQGGYTLVALVVVLSMLGVASMQYMERTAQSLQMSGYARDSAESLLLAEAAMNMVYGRFIYDGDLDRVNGPDNLASINTKATPPTIPLPYMYYVTAGDGIDQSQPSLLQRVADGEAAAQGADVDDRAVPSDIPRLRVDNLFNAGGGFAPLMFGQDDNDPGLQVRNGTWTGLESPRKAAAWLELVRDPDTERLQVFVEAVGQVGNAKSYVQRFVGSYTDTLGHLGALNESNPEPASGRIRDNDKEGRES